MDVFKLKKEFDRIVKENNFTQKEKLDEIMKFLNQGYINIEEFSKKFNLKEEDSRIFLEFLQKGIEFKKSIQKE